MPSEMEWNITDPVMILKFNDLTPPRRLSGDWSGSAVSIPEEDFVSLEVQNGLKLDGTGRAPHLY